jgi:hypothetical protein
MGLSFPVFSSDLLLSVYDMWVKSSWVLGMGIPFVQVGSCAGSTDLVLVSGITFVAPVAFDRVVRAESGVAVLVGALFLVGCLLAMAGGQEGANLRFPPVFAGSRLTSSLLVPKNSFSNFPSDH